MIMRSLLKYDFDFNFGGDKSNRFIPFIIGFLMYSASIAVISCFFTQNLTSDWNNALNGRITVEFQSNVDGVDETLTERQKEEVFQTLQSTRGIKNVRKLQESDILKILEPWLSSTAIPDDFPFPTIFDVEAEKNANVDLLALSNKLSKISQGVKVHDHANWYAPIMKISNGLFYFAVLLSLLIVATVCITVIFITKKTLSVHQDVVKILQLIGSNNSYIAAQFKRYYFAVGIRASLMSIALGILTILGMNFVLSADLLSIGTLKYMLAAVLIPAISTALIMSTSQNTVLFFLNNENWLN
jgi:cell division transport system permease protein